MGKRGGLLVAAGMFVLLNNGCGTVLNLNGPGSVYGGAAMDAAVLVNGAHEVFSPTPNSKFTPEASVGLGLVGLVDLPVSVIADTLTLPITATGAIMRWIDESNRPPTLTNPEDRRQLAAPLPPPPSPDSRQAPIGPVRR